MLNHEEIKFLDNVMHETEVKPVYVVVTLYSLIFLLYLCVNLCMNT